MTISPSTLDTWTNQGSTTNSSDTYSSVKNAIKNARYGLERDDFDHTYEIHLQGSYANNTNTYGSSDVDIVVRVTNPFEEDLTDLTSREKERFWAEYTDLSYEWYDFYSRVQRALRSYFGRNNIEVGDKAIKVKSTDDTPISKDADVVACADFRNYNAFPADGTEKYDTGMFFRTQSTGRAIVNYSKIHRSNGTKKNENTNGRYKPTVRMFKNARDTAVNHDLLDSGVVSSYYLEGLLYNVPDEIIDEYDLQSRYLEIVDWCEGADIGNLLEQSQMYPLCRSGDPDRWSVESANETIEAFATLWDEY